MDPGFASLIKCPACNTVALEARGREIVCRQCSSHYSEKDGYLDLLAGSSSGEPTPPTAEQRLMESELVARLYERFWRPAFVRVMAGGGAAVSTGGFAGEFFIHKNALAMEERDGPWLDLSSGPGLFTRAMAAAAPGANVVGLDVSRAMLDVAARRCRGYSNILLVRADAHDLPFGSDCFGGVNNAGALHAYDDPEAVFSEVFRVMRPGGIYVGSTFAPSLSLQGMLAARLAGIRRVDPRDLHGWLSRIGFADYDEIRLRDAFIFRVRKP